jgi:iron complex outermembrane receptor protein
VTRTGFNRQEVYNLYANPFTTTVPPVTFADRQQHLLQGARKFEDQDDDRRPGRQVRIRGFGPHIGHHYNDRSILVSRDASALTGSVSVDLAYPTAGVLLPSRLNDTTDYKGWTQELRLSSKGGGPLQWLVGAFYSDADRDYAQRLPTPGYDAFTDARFGAGTSAAVANGSVRIRPTTPTFPTTSSNTRSSARRATT